MTNVIGYQRVSTDEQGRSGLGLEAQKAAIEEYAERMGYTIIDMCGEVASAKGELKIRAGLTHCLNFARTSGALIVVAKLDRLSRDVAEIATLMKDRKVRFECADSGAEVSEMELHFRAIFAEEERRKISERTRAALAALKARGVRLGNPVNLREAGARGNETVRAAAVAEAERYRAMLSEFSGQSFREIARTLNKRMVPTVRGCQWTHCSVGRIMNRLRIA